MHWWRQGRSKKWIAKRENVSKKTVNIWIQRFQTTGGVQKLRSSGRPAALSDDAAEMAYQLLLDPESHGAAHVAQQLFSLGLISRVVSKATIIRAAKRVGEQKGETLVARRGRPAVRLSEKTRAQRLRFAKAHRKTNWGTFLFTDRKKFLLRYPGARVLAVQWLRKGEQHRVSHASKPAYINVYAGLCKHGVTSIRVVAGSSGERSEHKNKKGQPARNITAAEYAAVVKDTLLPGGRRLFSRAGVASWTLQQDNDPTHRAAGPVIKEWNRKHNSSVKLLENWPPSSPDLNPIENLWAHLQARVNARTCRNYWELKQALIEELQQTPKGMCERLVGSMGKRLEQVLEKGGERIRY